MKKCDIVVIDSGVDVHHAELYSKTIEGISIAADGIHDDISDQVGHGTAICGIIFRHVTNAHVFVIKIVNNADNLIEDKLLCAALNYIYENIDCRVVNVSMGLNVVQNHSELYELCNKIRSRNIMIVSAFDNFNVMSYPASYDNVIGVESCDSCGGVNEVYINRDTCINAGAYGKMQRILGLNNTCLLGTGNSYACAHVAALLLKSTDLMSDLCKPARLQSWDEKLREECNQLIRKPTLQYGRVVVYPFNKEMHSLIRYHNLLQFDLIDVYDTKYSASVGAETANILGDKNSKNFRIKNIDDVDWDSFDTIIIGHTKELEKSTRNHILKAEILIKEALSKGKYVYSFDDYYSNIEIGQHPKYFSPSGGYTCKNDEMGKFYKLGTPVLGVFGTSSRQGKFSLQLILRDKLKSSGYDIAQLGTEPSAYLFNMDACYHFGYGTTLNEKVNVSETILYLNRVMHYLDLLEKDIIITGCQSNIASYVLNNVNDVPLAQSLFLYGTIPDAVVLCVNYHDDLQFILRSLRSVEALVDCTVIALVLFPMTYVNHNYGAFGKMRIITDQEYEKFKKALKELVGIPIYMLNNENHMDELVNDIISFFS